MTTIAWDGKTLASDSRSCMGDMIYEEDCQKLFSNVGPFLVIGIAGNFQSAMDVIEMIRDFPKMDHIRSIPSDQIGEVSILGVADNGALWAYAGDKSCELRADQPFAVGSGSPYALAAMDMGYNAEEAVQAAARRDPFTNTKIQIAELQFEDPEADLEDLLKDFEMPKGMAYDA